VTWPGVRSRVLPSSFPLLRNRDDGAVEAMTIGPSRDKQARRRVNNAGGSPYVLAADSAQSSTARSSSSIDWRTSVRSYANGQDATPAARPGRSFNSPASGRRPDTGTARTERLSGHGEPPQNTGRWNGRRVFGLNASWSAWSKPNGPMVLRRRESIAAISKNVCPLGSAGPKPDEVGWAAGFYRRMQVFHQRRHVGGQGGARRALSSVTSAIE